MVRLVRGGDVLDVWIDGHTRLCMRRGDGPVEILRTPPRLWVARGLREVVLDRLADGWRRTRDPAREPDVDDEPREPRFEALAADPEDLAAALVYADWYQERDHPRGELIAVQCGLVARPDDAELRAREAALLRDWSEHLVGALDRSDVELTWRRGFVDGARLSNGPATDCGELVWELLRHPSARLLRELELARWSEDAQVDLALLMSAEPPPRLRVLHALTPFHRPCLAQLAARFPHLEDLVLANEGTRGDVAAMPAVRRFAFRAGGWIARESVARICAAPWPALEELELQFTPGDTDLESDDLAALLALDAPRLRTLRLHVGLADGLVERIVRSTRAGSLVVLDLSDSDLTDAGAATLAAHRAAFARLAALHVEESELTGAGLEDLARAGYPVVATAGRYRAAGE